MPDKKYVIEDASGNVIGKIRPEGPPWMIIIAGILALFIVAVLVIVVGGVGTMLNPETYQPKPTPTVYVKHTATVTKKGQFSVNVYAKPDTKAMKVSYLSGGDKVEVLPDGPVQADGDTWQHVNLRTVGMDGWVQSKYLGEVSPPLTPLAARQLVTHHSSPTSRQASKR